MQVDQGLNGGLPIFKWLDTVEDMAMDQAQHLAQLPFAFHHIALMPDCHSGYGMPIGGVLATNKVVIPNAVGLDIGCGMCAIKTPWNRTEVSIEQIKKIMSLVREAVPVGMQHNKIKAELQLMPSINGRNSVGPNSYPIVAREFESARCQLGTLGGGNHFIEFQTDPAGYIWIMLHSGSRNLGKQVADYYNHLAQELNGKWFAYVPKEWQLAFLPLDSQEGQDYLREMNYCVDFALANRKLMMERIIDCFVQTLDIPIFNKEEKDFNWEINYYDKRNGKTFNYKAHIINIAHNYASMEHHFGKDVMIHRKGATLARKGTIGIIPGSQGTKSYIVEGLGNEDSFMSCSHGAGRLMSRTKAQENLNLEEEIKKLDDKGIVHGVRTKKDLDEAAGAYKDIDEVMEKQKDLVETLIKLKPIAVMKG